MQRKIIYIHNNYEPDRFPKKPDAEDRFYTYGFGSYFARNFKHYYPDYEVEMWRLDSYTNGCHEKTVQNVKFRIFKSKVVLKTADFSYKFLKELKKEIKANDPILFISHVHTWLVYQIAFFFPQSQITVSHHGDWSPFFRIKYRKGIRKLKDFLDMQIEKHVMKNIHYFLLCDFRQIPYIKKAVPNFKYAIFSTGLDIKKIVPIDKNIARDILGWDANKKYIIYLGKLYRYKQPLELIKIWKEIKQTRPDVELVILGSSENDEYFNEAVNSGAIIAGRVLNKDLYVYYSAADVYVLIALRDDYFGGIGIAPLESLACNTPVVSYALRNYIGRNTDELGEMPSDLEGYKQGILKVLDNPGIYKNMRKGVEEHYSYKAVAQRMEQVFKFLNENRNKKT